MIIEVIKEEKTIEQATALACEELGKDRMDVSVEVLSLPQKRLFGKMKSLAKVRVYYEIEEKEPVKEKVQKKPIQPKKEALKHEVKGATAKKEQSQQPKKEAVKTAPVPGLGDKKIAVAQAYITNLLNAMGFDKITQTVEHRADSAVIRLEGEGLGVIIGRRGETLDAFQYLVSLACCRRENEDYRIYIDCGNFRQKREETLRGLAARVARQVEKNGRSTALEPMNPYERRIIHSVISEIPGLFSRSVGEEPHRKVVIMLEKNKDKGPRNRK